MCTLLVFSEQMTSEQGFLSHHAECRAQPGWMHTGEGALELAGEGSCAVGAGGGPPLAALQLLGRDGQQSAGRRAHAHQRPDRRVARKKLVRLRHHVS